MTTATKQDSGVSPAKRAIDKSQFSGRIAARFRLLREERGWSVADVAEKLNRLLPSEMHVANSTLHNWDNASRKFDSDYYPAIARVFGLTVAEFLPKK